MVKNSITLLLGTNLKDITLDLYSLCTKQCLRIIHFNQNFVFQIMFIIYNKIPIRKDN